MGDETVEIEVIEPKKMSTDETRNNEEDKIILPTLPPEKHLTSEKTSRNASSSGHLSEEDDLGTSTPDKSKLGESHFNLF